MPLLPAANCLTPATLLAVSARLLFPAPPAARALFAAALLISAYALLRYWRSLGGRSSMVRFSLLALRAVTLLL
ncbi:MAG: hypothetical protein M3362_21465, partial [Acidobacteriota bacterium]|nr:hypothetical protein [Acidobacteriota bacterium]